MECLEVLDLCETDITELHESIECLSRVVSIKLKFCKRLGSLPTSICKLKSLKELDLSLCSRFKSFPEISEPMECLEVLDLCGTDITELHESFGTTLVGLKKLDLSYCESLVSVPDSIWELNRLEDFRLDGCLKLKKLPPSSSVILGSLISYLDLSGCTSLEEIPAGLMICLTSLTSLLLRSCERLQSLTGLPCLLRILDVDGCTNLRVVSFSMAAVTQGLDQTMDAEKYSFRSCINLEKNAKNNIIANAQLRIMRMSTAYSKHKQINQEFKNRYLSNGITRLVSFILEMKFHHGSETGPLMFPMPAKPRSSLTHMTCLRRYGEVDEFYLDRIKVKRCGVAYATAIQQGQDVVAVDQDVGEPQPDQVISRKRIRDEHEASGSATVTEF
ncbi:hypothetical protein M0R45_032109 [Rubus argutus]|uniref:Disease resistance protein RPS4B/Roq1-like leucine-rich repeats domain-containing protein n=1 Tax=Rubus argutus TaxID=59490 RepID=A0AAW1WFJ3_RUBAR